MDLVPRLALLNEITILHGARGVEHHGNAVLFAQLADGAHVLHGLRLSARHVHRARDAYIRDLARPGILNDALQLGEVHVALEGVRVRGVVRFINDHVGKSPPGEFLVQTRGGEVHVARNDVARVNHNLRQKVLCGAPLMCGDEILISIILSYSLPQVIKILAAGIGFVTQHHPRPLAVAHSIGAAVGQQVDVDVLGAQQKGVVARLQDKHFAFTQRGHADGFDHFNFPGFRP